MALLKSLLVIEAHRMKLQDLALHADFFSKAGRSAEHFPPESEPMNEVSHRIGRVDEHCVMLAESLRNTRQAFFNVIAIVAGS
jgi:hypothetical protein